MSISPPLASLSYLFIFFMILLSLVPSLFSHQLDSDRLVTGQETNSSILSDAEILASINQTYLSLIPLMIREVENTNASDIPIRQIMEATPSNVTELQDIVKNNSAAQRVLNSTFSDVASSSNNGSIETTTTTPIASEPQDLIPVVVNMTQNTNASDIPIQNVIDTVPSNVTALQDIVKNSSIETTTTTPIASEPQDLIPVVVNMTQNTNASELGFMRIINSTPNLENINSTASN